MDETGNKNCFLGDFTRGIRRYCQMYAVIEIGRWDEKGVGGEMEAKPKGKDVMGWGKNMPRNIAKGLRFPFALSIEKNR